MVGLVYKLDEKQETKYLDLYRPALVTCTCVYIYEIDQQIKLRKQSDIKSCRYGLYNKIRDCFGIIFGNVSPIEPPT